MFLVTGENKRPALSHIFTTEANQQNYPAAAIQPEGELWWLLDESAGGELKG
jgi:6-phosphogluconolactonase